MARRKLRAVSLFSNCGAGDVGYAAAGFQFDVMAELDPRRMEVCCRNHANATGVVGDLRSTWLEVVDVYKKKSKGARLSLLAACPPCQGMSTARSFSGKGGDPDAGMFDARNLLVTTIANVAKSLMPKVLVVENVQPFLTRQIRHPRTGEGVSAASFLIAELKSDYAVFPIACDLCNFGVPQTRKRAFLTFVHNSERGLKMLKDNMKVPYPRQSHSVELTRKPITLRNALKKMNLPSLDASTKKKATSNVGGGLHTVPVWNDARYPMVKAIPRHTGQSAWDNDSCQKCGSVEVAESAANCPICSGPLLRPVVKSGNGRFRLVNGFRNSTYRRMNSDRPSATVTTASGRIGSNNTIHPFENRLLSPLECALLQTLPRSFNWGDALEKFGHTNIRAMIGEAVPPLFTKKHGKALRAVLENDTCIRLMGSDDSCHQRAVKKLGTKD